MLALEKPVVFLILEASMATATGRFMAFPLASLDLSRLCSYLQDVGKGI